MTIDENGMAVPWYAMTDELDLRNTHRALEAQVRLHHAAGARRIYGLAQGQPTWRVGDDLEAFIARLQRIPIRAGGFTLFAAHQMGTCRMGRDPQTSVANPRGQLHDVEGVWIGDASAFPTPSGTNPMITIMALASRTAENIAAGGGRVPPGGPGMTATPTLIEHAQLYIGGEWVDPSSDATIDVVNASTEEVMGRIPEGSAADVDRAVEAARGAFEAWSQTPLEQRVELCSAISLRLQERQEEIAALISQELGSPITVSMMVQAGLPIMDFGSMAHLVEHIPWEQQIGNSLVVREPIGVVGAITPWNYPLHQIAAKVAPAMTAGCTIVVKP